MSGVRGAARKSRSRRSTSARPLPGPATDTEPTKGLLDTSVVIASDVAELPDEAAISVATLAELHFGVYVAPNDEVRKARVRRLTEVEAAFDALPIDAAVARSYGALAHTVASAGRRPRTYVMDVFIAATAHAHRIPLYTKNADDFRIFEDVLDLRFV